MPSGEAARQFFRLAQKILKVSYGGPGENRPRLSVVPPHSFGLGTASHARLLTRISSGVRFRTQAKQLACSGGPGENRTRASAMRMLCNTTLLRARKYLFIYTDNHCFNQMGQQYLRSVLIILLSQPHHRVVLSHLLDCRHKSLLDRDLYEA